MEPVIFTEDKTSNFEEVVNKAMEKPIKHYEKELASIRTGRASSSLVEDLKIECYGNQVMRLKELASIATPEARLITIQPWDNAVVANIEKAILASDLGLTPASDGKMIRLQLPEMTAHRREDLIKILNKRTEEAKIAIRNVRKEYHNQIRNAEKNHGISEDFAIRLTELLQKITDEYIKQIEELNQAKAEEIKFDKMTFEFLLKKRR
ncbi:ribosome recycling factor [Candidatus Dependentiae bacterium]|nr:ribosome recycling factor [Candidatus Dependentiae bacterium]